MNGFEYTENARAHEGKAGRVNINGLDESVYCETHSRWYFSKCGCIMCESEKNQEIAGLRAEFDEIKDLYAEISAALEERGYQGFANGDIGKLLDQMVRDHRSQFLRAEKLERTINRLLENGSHYRCSGCDEIFEKPPASIVPIVVGHTACFCQECSE